MEFEVEPWRLSTVASTGIRSVAFVSLPRNSSYFSSLVGFQRRSSKTLMARFDLRALKEEMHGIALSTVRTPRGCFAHMVSCSQGVLGIKGAPGVVAGISRVL